MSAKIPDELKADVPQTRWGKILVATPVVMTVVATFSLAARQRNYLWGLAAAAGAAAVSFAIYVYLCM
jgi:hypothetical protein